MEPDQDRQNVGPDLDPNCVTLLLYSERIFLKKFILKKNQQKIKKHAKLPCRQSSKLFLWAQDESTVFIDFNYSNFFTPMKFFIKFGSVESGCSIVYIEGSRVIISN